MYPKMNMLNVVRLSKLNEVLSKPVLSEKDLEVLLEEFNTPGINGQVVRKLVAEIKRLDNDVTKRSDQ